MGEKTTNDVTPAPIAAVVYNPVSVPVEALRAARQPVEIQNA